MKRRRLIQYSGASVAAALGGVALSSWERVQAQTSGLNIQWLGHTCFLFSGGGQRVLVNPFRTLGCTAGYRSPRVAADLVMISSQLLDEGAVEIVPGNPRLLYEAGAYQVGGKQIQGIRTDHDRLGGLQFGANVAWRWNQAGINVLHLGAIAGPISLEQQILMGRPDVLCIPVGGGPKAYNPEEAKQAIQALNPRLVIPTHYRTQASKGECEISSLDQFLTVMQGTPVRRGGDSIGVRSADLPREGRVIQVMTYRF